MFFKFLLFNFIAILQFEIILSYTPAQIDETRIISDLGQNTNLSCNSYGEEILTCLWERENPNNPDNPTLINFNAINAKSGRSFQERLQYSYYGNGLKAGQCGLFIKDLRKDDISRWKCTIFTKSKVFRGNVDIVSQNIANEENRNEKIQSEVEKFQKKLLEQVRSQVRTGTHGLERIPPSSSSGSFKPINSNPIPVGTVLAEIPRISQDKMEPKKDLSNLSSNYREEVIVSSPELHIKRRKVQIIQ